MFIYHIPETAVIGIAWYSFKHNGCCAIEQRSVKEITVARNPTNICGAPKHVSFLIVKHVFESVAHIYHVTRGCMQHSFGLAGRSGCIKYEQGILCPHRSYRTYIRCPGHQIGPPQITAFLHINSSIAMIEHYTGFNPRCF